MTYTNYIHLQEPGLGIKRKRTDDGINERKNKRERERERAVCRLLQSYCTTLEFQTRTLGRAESRGREQGRGKGEKAGRQRGERANTS